MPNLILDDGGGFNREARRAASWQRRFDPKAWDAVKTASLSVQRRIKIRMPVDTGLARAQWGVGIWEEDQSEKAITQGSFDSEDGYVQYLEEGHSSQAPAGFITAEALRGGLDLMDLVAEAVIEAF